MENAGKEVYRLACPEAENTPQMFISYGLPFTEACTRHAETTFQAKRVYIIASTSLSRSTSLVADLEQALGDRHAKTWIGIRPHTPWDDLVPIINDIREVEPDLLVTLGGGSLTDGAKIIVYAVANGVKTIDDLERLYRPGENDGQRVPDKTGIGNDPTLAIVFIPTTLSAGEFSCFGGSTNPVTLHKGIMGHRKMFARLIVLDPRLTLTTPRWVWISTGIRAIDHCVETLCSNVPVPAQLLPIAIRSLTTLIRNIVITAKDPSLLQPRLDCAVAAGEIAGNLLLAPQVSAGASHGIGHQLGPLGVGHGQTSCILLPAVLRYNRLHSATSSDQAEKQEKLKRIIWDSSTEVRDILESAGGLHYESADAGTTLRALFNALDMPNSLKAVGVDRSHFDALATNSLNDICTLANPVPLNKEGVMDILETLAE
ncbi:hypothetical protein N7462_004512 [Penicillium macrosclerotiorum]|uniref:uncharacterized protein n=1 Tax=Penicillium macrosclerotiorum TaxID=303699 RepID=UPI002546FC83|nr:uncharacterized protein N7462_004512 [Penicillium macrosclerotiorum]KAJ5690120.1 hypothetical protein N7462_004512 [Penicillium macrosclerotiorum]